MNGDGSLDFEEFTRITRHVEPEFYLKHKNSGLRRIFNFFAEYEEDEEEFVITPIKFKKLCAEHGIYSQNSQEKFLSIMSQKGMATKVEELISNWAIFIRSKIKIL